MHPYDHALSSTRTNGGNPTDYLALHRWFDASKSCFAFYTHRMLRHHAEGIQEAAALFGDSVRLGGGGTIKVTSLGEQHLREDLGCVPPAERWLACLPADHWLTGLSTPAAGDLAVRSARRHGGEPQDYLALHAWFLETAAWFDDGRHLAMRHHAFGIFAAEERFGVVLDCAGGRVVPTRIVAERHVRDVLRAIPTVADLLRSMKGERWMNAASSPAALGLRPAP